MERIRQDYLTTWLPDGRLRITAATPGRRNIYWSAMAYGFTDDNELPAFEDETVVDNPLGPRRRCYYHIFSGDSYGIAAPRVLIPDRFANLRDLGGYNTEDGSAFVAFGKLYRSHMLDAFDEGGRALLDSLTLRSVVDLRMPDEAARRPDPPIEGADYYNLPPMTTGELNQFAVSLEDLKRMGSAGAATAHSDMQRSYRAMAFGNEAYRQLFRLLVEGKTPLLFHCAAGKDRTGIAAALILWALDVPRDTIYYDYMLTNEARRDHIDRMIGEVMREVDGDEAFADALRYFVGVDASSLRSTFDEIDSKYQDKQQYFSQELQVTPDDLAQLKRTLLVPHRLDGEDNS